MRFARLFPCHSLAFCMAPPLSRAKNRRDFIRYKFPLVAKVTERSDVFSHTGDFRRGVIHRPILSWMRLLNQNAAGERSQLGAIPLRPSVELRSVMVGAPGFEPGTPSASPSSRSNSENSEKYCPMACMRTKGGGDGPYRGVLIRQRFNSDFDLYASEDQQRRVASSRAGNCIRRLPDRSQAERLVVESVPHAACIVATKPEAKFNPSVDRAVE